jgi:hypothetical protein
MTNIQTDVVVAVLVASALAAFLACLDTAVKVREPSLAFKTKEWWLLWLVNCAVAFIVIYAAGENGKLSLSSFLGFCTAVFGYPLLLHAKLLSFRGDTPEEERSVGPQFFLEVAERLLVPGMRESIDQKSATFLALWRRDLNMAKLGKSAQDYIRPHAWPQNGTKPKEEIQSWVDKLMADTQANPGNADDNARALFLQIREIGGLRGVRWVLRQSKKD